MLKIRIIPTLLWEGFGLIKGITFDSWRHIGSVLPAIKIYNNRDVDELILLDIAANHQLRGPDYESIKEFASECFVPFTVGGGITQIDQIQKVLSIGADKVSINTASFTNPSLIEEAIDQFGSQCIVGSIDFRMTDKGTYECYSHSGRVATGKEPVIWAQELERLGVGEILLTSIDRDGTMQGYEFDIIRKITKSVDTPVIASGGAGNYHDMLCVIQNCGVAAVAASSMFQFTQQTPTEAKKYLSEFGIPVRNSFPNIW